MSAVHGSKATLKLGTVAVPDTADQDLTVFANSLGATFNRDNAEVTTMGLDSKKYIPGMKDATIPYEGPFDTAADPIMWDLFNNGVIVAFEYAPAGLLQTGPKYTGMCFIVSYELSTEVGDAASMSGEMQVTGDVVRTTFA